MNHKKGPRRHQHENLAERVGCNRQEENYKRLLPESRRETERKRKLDTKLYDHDHRPREPKRLKIIEAPNCPCGNDNQTTEHILLECKLLNEDRERIIAAVAKTDNWPINKDMLIKKHYKAFAKFTEKLDKIQEINSLKKSKAISSLEGDQRTNTKRTKSNNHCK